MRATHVGTSTGTGRVHRITSVGERTLATVDGPDGLQDVVVAVAPDRERAAVATAGLRRLQWVRVDLDAEVPTAHLAGSTRQPHLRRITIGAALALAEQGVPSVRPRGAHVLPCHCRGVSDKVISCAIACGASTPDAVADAGRRGARGGCRPGIEALLAAGRDDLAFAVAQSA